MKNLVGKIVFELIPTENGERYKRIVVEAVDEIGDGAIYVRPLGKTYWTPNWCYTPDLGPLRRRKAQTIK